jgi:hypothetical protein
MKMERIKSSETSAYKKQTPGNHPQENIQHYEHGESLKSRIWCLVADTLWNAACTGSNIVTMNMSVRNMYRIV